MESFKGKRRLAVVVESSMGGGGDQSCCLPNVADDLLMEILLRLPVLSLLRFKSVHKSWYSFITAPDFIHDHATMEDRLDTFIFRYGPKSPPQINKTCQYCPPRFFLLSGNEFEVFNDLGTCPLDKPYSHCLTKRRVMTSSCHGIVCLYDDVLGDVYLWNPAMKQFRCLPKRLPGNFSSRRRHRLVPSWYDFVAFGFDVKAKDYKVLTFTTFKQLRRADDYVCQVQVYSLNTDSWKYIDGPKIQGLESQQGRYLNGKYYFCGKNYVSVQMILSFDFSEETFRTLEIMETVSELKFIGEKVAYIKYNCGDLQFPDHASSEVWELNECCGKESWTKRYDLGPMPSYNSLRAFSKNGEIGIVNDCDGLKMFNFVTQKVVKEFQFLQSTMMTFSADVYKESLVSVERNGLSCDNNNNNDD